MIPVRVSFRYGKLGAEARLVAFALFAALGVFLQLAVPYGLVPGTLLIAAPLALLAAKPWTNKPDDQGEEDWQPAGLAEVDRIADSFRAARSIKLPFWYRPASGIPVTLVLAGLAFITLGTRASLFFVDALLLLWPTLHFLRIRVWIPRNLEMSMGCAQAALSVGLPEGIVVTPYLRLDRDAEGLRIPEDVRLMVEPRRGKSDLVGIQLQTAVNSGPNGAVPYFYAVVLTRGQGASWRAAAAFRRSGYEVESGGDDEYGTVVIRQRTSGGGYHTDADDCRRLMQLSVELLRAL